MFRDMIASGCSRWYASRDCTVRDMIDYIQIKGSMRDAQIQAI